MTDEEKERYELDKPIEYKPFPGAQPERTKEEEDKIKAYYEKYNTPENKQKQKEYLKHHENETYDEDF